ncbi:hypothetical protein ACLMJK_007425 [Lecanora helva]
MSATDQQNPHLPRILCLHGGGTSALIFRIQTRRLQQSLREHFQFVFVDGPFEAGPGPGVLPVFEDCGPYYSWIYPPNPLLGQKRVRQVLRDAIKADGGYFVGVLGFSQGGRQTAGLLADLQKGEDTHLPSWKFGVCLCASYPPYSLEFARNQAAGKEWKGQTDGHGEIREPEADEIIHVPSVHVRGTNDPHLEKGRRLVKFFDSEMVIEMEFNISHHLPGAAGDTTSEKGDNEKIRDAIIRIYEEGKPEDRGKAYGNGTRTN